MAETAALQRRASQTSSPSSPPELEGPRPGAGPGIPRYMSMYTPGDPLMSVPPGAITSEFDARPPMSMLEGGFTPGDQPLWSEAPPPTSDQPGEPPEPQDPDDEPAGDEQPAEDEAPDEEGEGEGEGEGEDEGGDGEGGEGEGEDEGEGEGEGQADTEGTGEGEGEGGDAAQAPAGGPGAASGGRGAARRAPAIQPAAIARLRGTQAPRIEQPPKLSPDQVKGIEAKTGISPDEHHDRVRAALARLSRAAHQAQVGVVREVESSAADLRRHVEGRAHQIPRVVGGAVARIRAAIARAKADIRAAADNAMFNVDSVSGVTQSTVESNRETTLASIETAIGMGTRDAAAVYNEVSGYYDVLAQEYHDWMKDVPNLLAPAFVPHLTTTVAMSLINSTTGTAEAQYDDERRGIHMVPTARQAKAALDIGGEARAEDLASERNKLHFSKQFLSMTNPAAVNERQVGTVNQTTMTCEAGRTERTLVSANEQAIGQIMAMRDQAMRSLDRTETDAVTGLRRAGRSAHIVELRQAWAMQEIMRRQRAPFAEAYATFMQRLRAGFPPGAFFDYSQLGPRLRGQAEQLTSIREQQQKSLHETRAQLQEQADDTHDKQVARIWDMVRTTTEVVTGLIGPTVAGIEHVGLQYIRYMDGEGASLLAEVPPHRDGSGTELSEFAQRVRTLMYQVLEGGGEVDTSIRDNFHDQVQQFQTHCEDVRDNFKSHAEGSNGWFRTVDDQTEGDLQSRTAKISAGADDTTLLFPSTDERKIYEGIGDPLLTPKGLAGLKAYFLRTKYTTIEWVCRDEMSGQDLSAALNLLAGRNAEAALDMLEISDGFWGRDRQMARMAVRNLNSTEMGQLQLLPGYVSARDELLGDLHGRQLEVTRAYFDRNRPRALALEVENRMTQARERVNQDGTIDLAVDLQELSRQELMREHRMSLITDERAREFQHSMFREHAVVAGQADAGTQAGLSDERARELFLQHSSRDIRVWVQDPDYGDRGTGGGSAPRGHYETRTLSATAKGALEDVVNHGPNSPVTRGARLAFEHEQANRHGLTEQRRERITGLGVNQELVDARAAYQQAISRDPPRNWEIRRAQERLSRAERDADTANLSFANRLGAPAEARRDPTAAREFATDSMGELFGRLGHWGREFGRSMIRDGQPDLLAAYMISTQQSGTHERLMNMTFSTRTPEEIERTKLRFAALRGRPGDTSVFDRHYRSELSGDDRNDFEDALLGRATNDQMRTRAAWQDYQQEAVRIGRGGRSSMRGTAEQRFMDHTVNQLEDMILAAVRRNGGTGPAFIDGIPNPQAFDNGQFAAADNAEYARYNQLMHDMGFASREYRAELDRHESFWTGLIQALGAIVAIALMFIPGVNLVVAGIAAALITGLATIAVKSSFRGERYGHEEMLTDVGMMAIDVATAGFGGGAAMRSAAAAKALAKTAGQRAATQLLVRHAIVRGALTTGLSSAASTAIQDGTWTNGFWGGLGRVFGAGVRGALVGAVTEGVSTRLGAGFDDVLDPSRMGGAADALLDNAGDRLSRMQRVGRWLGPGGRQAVSEGLSDAIGGTLGEAAGIGADVLSGQFKGDLGDVMGRLATTFGRELIGGALRGRVMARNQQRYRDRYAALVDSGRTPSPDQIRHLERLAISAGMDNDDPGGFGSFRHDRAAAEQQRGSVLGQLPPAVRGRFQELPLSALMRVGEILAGGGVGSARQRLDIVRLARDHNLDLDVPRLTDDLRTAGRAVEAQRDADRAARRTLLAGVDPELRGRLRDLPVDAFRGLPPDVLQRIATLIASGDAGTAAQRAALLRDARAANPDLDARSLVRGLQEAAQAGARARDEARAARHALRKVVLEQLPVHMRATMADLPDNALRTVRGLLEEGGLPSAQQRESLYRAARRANPGLERATFLRDLDAGMGEARQRFETRRKERRQARFEMLDELPDAVRGPLSALPDAGLFQLRLLQGRGGDLTPHERARLLDLALRETPSADLRRLSTALDEAMHHAAEPGSRARPADAETRAHMMEGLPTTLRDALDDVPLLVVRPDEFARYTGSGRGDAVTVMLDGRLTVVMRQGADPRVLFEEGLHVLQARHPEWASRVGALDEARLANWDRLPLDEQLALYRNKLDIEIDAHQRILADQTAELDAAPHRAGLRAQVEATNRTLANLVRRHAEVSGIGPARRRAIREGVTPRPQWLDQPARLFAKDPDGPQVPPDPARVRAIEEQVASARKGNDERDTALEQAIHGSTPARTNESERGQPIHHGQVFDHVTIGAGYAGIGNELMRSRGPNDLVIGGRNPWARTSPDQVFGQGPREGADLPDRPSGSRFEDVVADPDAPPLRTGPFGTEQVGPFARAIDHANHVDVNRHQAGIAVYPGQAGRIQRRVDTPDWPSWASAATVRIPVRGSDGQIRFLYAKTVDVASGPGPGRQLGAYEPLDHLPGRTAAPEGAPDLNRFIGRSIIDDATMAALVAAKVIHFGDQAFHPDQVRLPADAQVAVYGSGGSGAWAAKASRLHGGDVEWFGQIRDLGALPEGLHGVYERLRYGTPPAPTDTEMAQLRDWTFQEQRGNGYFPRNRMPGEAFDPAMNILRTPVTGLVRVDYAVNPDTGRKQIAMYFDSAPDVPVWKDHLVLSIGQDARAPGGPADLLGAFNGRLVPIYRADGDGHRQVVGLQSTDGTVKVVGNSATQAAVLGLLRNQAEADRVMQAWRNRAASEAFPPNSRTVVGGFFHMRQMFELLYAPDTTLGLMHMARQRAGTVSGGDAAVASELIAATRAALDARPTPGSRRLMDQPDFGDAWARALRGALDSSDPIRMLNELTRLAEQGRFTETRLNALSEHIARFHSSDLRAVLQLLDLHPNLSANSLGHLSVALFGVTTRPQLHTDPGFGRATPAPDVPDPRRLQFHRTLLRFASMPELTQLGPKASRRLVAAFLERAHDQVVTKGRAYQRGTDARITTMDTADESSAARFGRSDTPVKDLEAAIAFLRDPPWGAPPQVIGNFVLGTFRQSRRRSVSNSLDSAREFIDLATSRPPPLTPAELLNVSRAARGSDSSGATGGFVPRLALDLLNQGLPWSWFRRLAADPETKWGGVLGRTGSGSTLRGIAGEWLAEALATRIGGFDPNDEVLAQVRVFADDQDTTGRRPDLLLTADGGWTMRFMEVKAFSPEFWRASLEVYRRVHMLGESPDAVIADPVHGALYKKALKALTRLRSQLELSADPGEIQIGGRNVPRHQVDPRQHILPPYIITSDSILQVLRDHPHLRPVLEEFMRTTPSGTRLETIPEDAIQRIVDRLLAGRALRGEE